MLTGTSKTTGKSSGSQTVTIGWDVGGGSSGSPFVYLNPNSTDESRLYQTVSTLVIYEIKV